MALGWSRAVAVEEIVMACLAAGLPEPGLTEPMLCRWEHDPRERPSADYAVMIGRAYGTTLQALGLTRHARAITSPRPSDIHYGRPDRTSPLPTTGEPMTTAAGLPAVRESLHLALQVDPSAGAAVLEAAEAAVEHYALHYSRHPPHTLFAEVRATRGLLLGPLGRDSQPSSGLLRHLGWLSGMLGNLAHHLGDDTGARVHLSAAAHLGNRSGDARLLAWAHGAHSMTLRASGHHEAAVRSARRGLEAAPNVLVRAQLNAWALAPALAARGDGEGAEAAWRAAENAMAAAPGVEPGRWGYDLAEHRLHGAELHLTLSQPVRAAPLAEESVAATVSGTPGWAAATLLLARAEAAAGEGGDAAARALAVLDRVPANRLRATSRARLAQLGSDLAGLQAAAVVELRDRLRELPAPITPHGRPAPADQS
ncbi:hypothetical protein SAMN06297387_104298 [Streptomyces zhaozhouensis]|uniref:HTH cro/C1-type domain-containing protein n=2 Tax=Streptomyces zhaozhouensis TaxID=1300267 RepID=A0A286DTY8_9ACTN|nr:hypothetical protein SAMN06297387_104298 [Streptomyces zhaozhouensis]